MLRKLAMALALFGATALPLANGAEAAFVIDGLQAGDAQQVLPVEYAQFVPFFFGGNNFCWYPFGWNGPGWYWCGYAWRQGYGWGGPRGWRPHGGPGFYAGPGRGPRPGGWQGGAPRCHPGKGC